MAEDKVTFAAIVIVAIVAIVGILGLTGFGAIPQVTGQSTTALGTATVNITTETAIVLTDANISFGNGTVTQGSPFAILTSCNGGNVNATWANVGDWFVLENDGNVLANVSIKSANGKGFVGGTAGQQAYFFNYTNNEASSCLLDGGSTPSGAYNGLSTVDNVTCQKLNFSDASDALNICLKLQIPSDAPTGLKTDQITFTATQSA